MPENGVLHYTAGILTMPVYFPQGLENCRHCLRFLKYLESRRLHCCSLLDLTIEQADLDTRHPACPIELQTERIDQLGNSCPDPR